MRKRDIITIDKDKCNGCGECVVGCHEGALQIVDGKAKLVNESFCDGFGDCIGECPTGALKIEKREAEEFDLEATADHVKSTRGEEAVEEMLKAQKEHEEDNDLKMPTGGCPGSRMRTIKKDKNKESNTKKRKIESELEQWPIQLHLLPPTAPYFKEADLLITADCVPFANANYHQEMLQGKALAIACPKLDDGNAYLNKLKAIITNNDLNSITVARMEVPCCGGLTRLVEQAIAQTGSNLEVEVITVGIDGERK
ncbi:4Fe-4S binding protein [Natroniella acetigena]|uniref:ATP-binding protein n=1 Tax=Natroniella acetigena TaxID=52004 RepID=UPI00200A5259|nr:4Fe-4S dicluster domain-containing protein [Natroniella acetigena]MCK8828189.1 4Fe-4S binding protein [Natroniella acetigena]